MALACGGTQAAISRGQLYYEENQYEQALAVWRSLEPRVASLVPEQRARYAYLRGMTDYRLGYRDEARYWLALARTATADARSTLGGGWLDRLDEALAELHREPGRSGGLGVNAVQEIQVAVPPASRPERVADAGRGD